MQIEWIVAPLLGALIGYITNDLAIKMLFKPYKRLYVGKWAVPFTPGLIPKEKARLARSVGEVVGGSLLSEEAIAQALLSEAMLARVEEKIGAWLEGYARSEDSLQELLGRVFVPEQVALRVSQGTDFLTQVLSDRLANADLGQIAAQSVAESVKRKTPGALTEIFRRVAGERAGSGLTEQLRQAINGYLARHAQSLVSGAVDGEARRLLDAPLCTLVENYSGDLSALSGKLTALYARIVRENLAKALQAIDLSAIVRARVEAIADEDLEEAVSGVAGRELKAIVYLGAGLGFLMGFVNLLF
ncbi:MAG: DUF445 family protein [Clostridia bacterium]